MNARSIILFIFLLIIGISCNDDENFTTSCDDLVLVDSNEFGTESTYFELISAEVSNGCFQVKFSAPGCDGSSTKMRLIDSGVIKESNPVQRDLKLVLDNEELCLAIFTNEVSFDLSPLRSPDENVIQINLEGEQYIYSY